MPADRCYYHPYFAEGKTEAETIACPGWHTHIQTQVSEAGFELKILSFWIQNAFYCTILFSHVVSGVKTYLRFFQSTSENHKKKKKERKTYLEVNSESVKSNLDLLTISLSMKLPPKAVHYIPIAFPEGYHEIHSNLLRGS